MSQFIQKNIMLSKGEHFELKGRMWQSALFDTNDYPRRVFKMSRQVGKTVGEAAEAVARAAFTDNFKVLHISPSEKQARKFSQDKLGPIIAWSPEVQKRIGNFKNIGEKTFKGEGKIYIEYAKYDADRIRGITADAVYYDEVQDMMLEAIQGVVNQSLFTSEYKLRIYAGTPKTLDNGIEVLWQESDQREWMIACRHHSPVKWINIGVRSIGLHGPICHHCGNLLNVDDGIWVARNPGSKLLGFHVNQLQCAISHRKQADWDEILYYFEHLPEAQFKNEVLGESCDSAEVPLSLTQLLAACNPDISIRPVPLTEYFRSPIYAGIDWGHGESSTVLTLGQFDPDNPKIFRILFMKKYEGPETAGDYCIPDMAKIIKQWNVARTHVDYGGGFGLSPMLAKMIGRRTVTTNYYSDSAGSADHRWVTKNEELPRITLNRGKAMSAFINLIRGGRVDLPRREDFKHRFASDFTVIRREVDKKGNLRYIRIGHDDAFHSALYCYTIARHDRGGKW